MNKNHSRSLTLSCLLLTISLFFFSCSKEKPKQIDNSKEPKTLPSPKQDLSQKLYFKKISSSDGLPSTEITSTFHDYLGYTWISTGKGVARYDGYDIKLYTTTPEKNIYLDGASSFFEDNNKKLWLISGNGYLHWFDRSQDKFVPKTSHFEDGWAIEKGHNFFSDSLGNFWFTAYGGLQYYDQKTDSISSFPLNKVRDPSWPHEEKVHLESILKDNHGQLWLGSRKFGLIIFNVKNKEFHFFRDAPGFYSTHLEEWISDLAFDPKGNIWAADLYTGLYLIEPKSGNIIKRVDLESLMDTPKTVEIWDIEAKANIIWLATQNHGLIIYDAEKDQILNNYTFQEDEIQGISSNTIKDVSIDNASNVWLSGNGVNIGSPSFYKFQNISIPKVDKNAPPIYDLSTTENGTLLISTKEGILNYNSQNSTFSNYKTFDKTYKETFGVLTSNGSNFWTSNEQGIFKFNPIKNKKTQSYSRYHPLSHGNTLRTGRRFLEDSEGTIWFIDHWNRLKFIKPHTQEVGNVFDLAQDKESGRFIEILSLTDNPKNKEIIVGSNFGTAQVSYQSHNTKWLPLKYQSKDYGKSKCTYVYNDLDNNIWLIIENKIFQLNTETHELKEIENFSSYKTKSFKWLIESEKDVLWIGTFDGLIHYDKESKASQFYTSDNVSEGTFSKPSPVVSLGNQIYFGGQKGLTHINPSKINKDLKAPIPILERLKYPIKTATGTLRDTTIQTVLKEKVKLKHFQNDLSFSYIGIHLKNPLLNSFQYQLIGYDKNWVNAGNQRTATYTNLNPGEYTFQIKTANSDAVWSTPSKTIEVIILPPWWQTWWAYLIYTISAGLLLYAWIRYRVFLNLEKYKATENIRTKISADLHDDVGSILTGLSMKSELMALGIKEIEPESLNKISEMAREAMERMRDTVWAIDSRKDKYENLLDRMNAYANTNLPLKNFKYNFDTTGFNPKSFIQPDIRQNLYLIFKEAITNLLKHSNGDTVSINMHQESKVFYMQIKDNGVLKNKFPSDGLGQSNMKARAEKIGGVFKTYYDQGFIVEVALKQA